MHELIGDITLCILFAWVLGLLAHFSRQPLILAYLIAGFFIGPFGMGWVKSQESIGIIFASDVLPCVLALARARESGYCSLHKS